MIKRLIAILCAFTCLTASMVSAEPLYNDISEGSSEERVLNVVTGVGLMKGYTDGSFGPREHVTRAEVAQIIYNAVTQNFGSNSQTQETATSTFEWTDVDNSHWAYEPINYVAELGIMVGDGNGSFRPEDTVTYREIVKTVLNLSGYEYEAEFHGGWPVGYERIASNNGLNKGVSGFADSRMSRMDVARILYNLFALPVRELKWNGHVTTVEEKDETFMNDKMNVHAISGTLTKTDITSVGNADGADLYHAEIDGFEFIFNEEDISIRDYIGRNLRIFVYENEEEEVYELLCFETTGRDDVVTIDARYLEDFTDNTFSYYENDSYTKRKTLEVERGFHLIYNGKYTGTHTDETLEFDKGNITVISNTALGYDIIVAEDFSSGYAFAVNKTDFTVSNIWTTGTMDALIEFTSEDEEMIYSIIDTEGNSIQFKDLGKGAINFYKNGNYVKLYISTNVVTGKVTHEYSDDGEYYMEFDDVEYIVDPGFYDVPDRLLIENGMTATAYLDHWGEIVWITGDAVLANLGYLVSAVQEDDGEKILLKYYDIASKTGVMEELAEKIKYSDEYGIETKLNGYEASKVALEDYQGIFAYEKNAAGQITRVEIPLAQGLESNSQSRLRLMFETTALNKDSYKFHSSLKTFMGSDIYVNGSTQLLRVPADKKEYAKYSMTTANYISTGVYKMYNYNSNSCYASLLVTDNVQTSFSRYFSNLSLGIVTKVETVYDETQDEVVTQLTVTDGTTSSVIIPNTDYVDFAAVPSIYGPVGFDKDARYEVQPGDFVKYVTYDGKVVIIDLLYDADGLNPAWYGVKEGITVPDEYLSNSDVLGTIPGSTGFRNTGSELYSNPVGYSNSSRSAPQVAGEDSSHETFVLCFAHSYNEGLFTITTANLRDEDGDADAFDSKYFNMRFQPPTAVTVVKKTRNGVSVSTGSFNDIKTYAESGVNCSKLMVKCGFQWRSFQIFLLIEE